MKKTLTKSDFRQEFHLCGKGNNFSYKGLGTLFDVLEELDSEMELDVIALCCDFSEIDIKDIEKETGCVSLEELEEKAVVLLVDDERIIYQNF